MSSYARFVGNGFYQKPPLCKAHEFLVEKLRMATFETFYPNGSRVKIVSKSTSVTVSAASCDYVTLGAKFDLLADKKAAKYCGLVRSLYSDVEYSRAHNVPWGENKTDRELEAHLAIHLLSRLIVGFGIPTYDIHYTFESGARNSVLAFAYAVRKCFETLDLSDPASAIIAEGLIRTLVYLKRRNMDNSLDSLPNVTLSSLDRFELTPFETFELASFKHDLSRLGLPKVTITRTKPFNPPTDISLL